MIKLQLVKRQEDSKEHKGGKLKSNQRQSFDNISEYKIVTSS